MSLHKYFVLLLCLALAFACKKQMGPPGDEDEDPPVTNEEEEWVKERIYYYYKQQSLWTKDIPERDEEERMAFVKNYSSNERVLNVLKGLTTPLQSGARYRRSIDRFSFLDESDAEGGGSYADGFRMDTNEGYGLYFFWGFIAEENMARPVIYFVEGGSPGQQKEIKRGSIVLAINERENTGVPVEYDDGSGNRDEGYYLSDTRLANAIHDEWYAAMEEPELVLKVKNLEGATSDYTMSHASSYEIDPVILDSVYTYPGKKIGYLAYSSFEEVWPSSHRNYQKLESVFQSFGAANISDLILDLRYNPGGYVETAVYLAEKIIGASGDKQLIFTYKTNDYLADNPNFEPVYFDRKNALNLGKVFILVTEQTASAAELLISVLKPYMDVVLIGDGPRTYGKPAGFFPEEITDDVTLWVTSFETMNNAQTEEDRLFQSYWEGLSIASSGIVPDRIFYDFGDTQEDMIAKALDLAGVSTARRMNALSRKGRAASAAVKLGIINKPRERNMLKTKQ